ncbi:MAG: hypothetical protein HKP58_17655 [Desulfatitalea sp.]|nr:transposase [Desulfatitalea sp.]NNK02241.1 hypothetical protein [Desulfatitalea sp.]
MLDYLGRDTHRVAISNNRITGLDDGYVTSDYKNRDTNQKTKKSKNASRPWNLSGALQTP